MTNSIFAALAALITLVACTTDSVPRPTKIYDFSPAWLQDLRPTIDARPGPLSKTSLRAAIQAVQPALLACYTKHGHGTGTIELQLRLSGEPDGTLVDAVDFEGDAQLVDNLALVDCMRTIVMTLQLPAMQEAGVWLVNYPFIVGAK